MDFSKIILYKPARFGIPGQSVSCLPTDHSGNYFSAVSKVIIIVLVYINYEMFQGLIVASVLAVNILKESL